MFLTCYDVASHFKKVTMRKVELRMNEDYKYKIIKKLVETNGNKNSVCVKLNCSKRTVDRLIVKNKLEGKSGFVHE